MKDIEVLEKYRIEDEGINVEARIVAEKGKLKKYELLLREIPIATGVLLDEIKQQLIGAVLISAEEMLDARAFATVKERFRKKAKEILKEKIPDLEEKKEQFLIMTLMKDMLGIGDIEILLGDPNLEEVVITSASESVRVFHKKYGWLTTNVFPKDEAQIRNYANTIARRIGRQVTTLNPLLDAHLITGDRANAVLFPVSSKGNTIVVRKFARDPWTVTDFIKSNTADENIFALIWLAIQFESNILISGGTASGKTSLLNVCMPFIPPNHRILSIEDTRELMLPDFLYWTPLTTREANPEGKGEVSMLDLLVNALRMRPDRIILGEMRKKEQAEVLFEAMHTGHSVYATVHADSVTATIQRLTHPPIEVPPNLLGAVNLNVVMFRNRVKNIRRIYQVGEFIFSEEEGKHGTIKPNIIYRWNPSTDKIVTHHKSMKLFEELSKHTGLTKNEIDKDLTEKAQILKWMVKHDVRDISSVGEIFHKYYTDKEELVKAIKKDMDPKKILSKK